MWCFHRRNNKSCIKKVRFDLSNEIGLLDNRVSNCESDIGECSDYGPFISADIKSEPLAPVSVNMDRSYVSPLVTPASINNFPDCPFPFTPVNQTKTE